MQRLSWFSEKRKLIFLMPFLIDLSHRLTLKFYMCSKLKQYVIFFYLKKQEIQHIYIGKNKFSNSCGGPSLVKYMYVYH